MRRGAYTIETGALTGAAWLCTLLVDLSVTREHDCHNQPFRPACCTACAHACA